MEEFKWKDLIKVNRFVLTMLGYWPENEEYKRNFYGAWAFFSRIVFIYGYPISRVLSLVFGSVSLEVITKTIYLNITEMMQMVKVYYFTKNLPLLHQIMVTLDYKTFQPGTMEQVKLIEKDLRFWKMFYILFVLAPSSSIVLWSIAPILNHATKDYTLPFPAWFPYDHKKPIIYEITYIYQVIGITITYLTNVHMDPLLAAFTTYVGAQCDILANNLKHLNTLKEDSEESKKRSCPYDTNLIDCVMHHKQIVIFADVTNQFLDMLILGQFFTTAICTAFSMMMLVLVTPSDSEFYSTAFYLVACTIQIFIWCWFGNEVDLKSSQIPYSAFESDWTGIPLEARKNLIIFIIRAQRPIKMTALNLFSLSLTTFTAILRTSWSYFAVLRTVNSP